MYDDQREPSLAFPTTERITCTAPAVVEVRYTLPPWILAAVAVLVALAEMAVLVVLALM